MRSEVLANSPSLPSLALLDLAMPVMGGDELVPILRAKYPGLKIIISSGYPEEEARKIFPLRVRRRLPAKAVYRCGAGGKGRKGAGGVTRRAALRRQALRESSASDLRADRAS